MPINPEEVYWAMEAAYRHGVLDRLLSIQGEALEAVIDETGLNMGDMLNRMDETDEKTILKIERMLERSAPLIRFAGNDRLMRFASRSLDVPFIRRGMVQGMRRSLLRVLTGTSPPGALEKMKGILAGRIAQAPE